jgi:nucleoid DNA-binding protein
MRKADMVRRIAEATELTHKKAEEVVEAVFDKMKSALQQGDSVIVRRFGSFTVRRKRARRGRNPKTGQAATVTARRVVRFTSGNQLKAAVNRSSGQRM